MSSERADAATATTTAEELAALPDADHRYDLVRGELREMTPAGFRHGVLAARIAKQLAMYVDDRRLGLVVGAETGFVLHRGPDTVLGPDAAFVRQDRLPPDDQWDRYLDVAPDLVVEVVSPSDRASEVTDKALSYLDAGVPLVWVVYPPQRMVAVHRAGGTVQLLREGAQLDGGDVLPGFCLPVAELFA